MLDFTTSGQPLAVLLLDGFSMLSFGSLSEPMAFLAREFPDHAPELLLVSAAGKTARSGSGVRLDCDLTIQQFLASLSGPRQPRALFVCGGTDGHPAGADAVLPVLRRANRMGLHITGLGNANWLLAEAGVLSCGKGAVHWKHLPAFAERFGRIEAEDALFADSGSVTSCSGELATLDLVFRLIAELTPEGAEAAANHLLVPHLRTGDSRQPCSGVDRMRSLPETLRRAVRIMGENIEEPLESAEIADMADASVRQLQRLFRRHLNISPMKYYSNMRVDTAHRLITMSDLPMREIALASGYGNAHTLTKHFKARYGQTPCRFRKGLDALTPAPEH